MSMPRLNTGRHPHPLIFSARTRPSPVHFGNQTKMPTYRGISVELRSQFDVEALPEYFPRPQAYYTARGVSAPVPDVFDETGSTCSVYVPVLPASQFWINYYVSPPVPQHQFFLFKLFINGAHIVSWSCGKDNAWKGKTMFGLYEREQGEDGKKRIEKRALCFTTPDKVDGEWKDVNDAFDAHAYLEIRLHRASGRKRVARELEEYKETSHGAQRRGIE